MSILAQGTPSTEPSLTPEQMRAVLWGLAIGLPIAVALILKLGVFHRRSINGPTRLSRRDSLKNFTIVTLAGGFVWMFVQTAYVVVFKPNPIGPRDFAFLATVPPSIGLIALLIGDASLPRDVSHQLGLSTNNIVPGFLKALLAMLIVMPVMQAAGILLELLYRAIEYRHPSQHELLGAMKDAPQHVRTLLTIGACVCAPMFEEAFFRGHIQTILSRLLRRAGSRWFAVALTALIFASVHEVWSWPLIFLLALCLGYAYERTGNLWVPIFMHAIFNTLNTLSFLNQQ